MMIRNSSRKLALVATLGVGALALGLAACAPAGNDDNKPSNSEKPAAEAKTLRVWAGATPPVKENFNPFSPTLLNGTSGAIYEPLFFFNKTSDVPPVGELGESFEWNEDGTVLTVKIKSGLKWNDGKPFTAKDAAFSFNYEGNKRKEITKAEAPDDTTLVVTFAAPGYTLEFAVLGSTLMIPEHIWKDRTGEQVTADINSNPVGTGPYKVESVTSESYTLVANENFRDGAPAVGKVQYVAIADNATAQNLFTAGKLDWAGMFIPNPDSITGGGVIQTINTPQDPTVLYTCANVDLGCAGPQTDVAVRQALNLVIDRATIKEKAFVGLTGTISPTFALLGRDDKWIADAANKESPQQADVAAAEKILQDAGYAKNGDGIYAKDGKAVELDLMSVDGWSDYNDAAKLIQEQALKAGIKVNERRVSWDEFSDRRQSGKYQLIMGGVVGTSVADPFQIYNDWFGGVSIGSTSKVGDQVPAGRWNFSRYDNAKVNEAISAAAATNDEAAKKAAYATIQAEISRDLPYIPLVINATQTFYNAKDFTGWPTESDLYAFPPSWGAVSAGYVLQHLKPAGN